MMVGSVRRVLTGDGLPLGLLGLGGGTGLGCLSSITSVVLVSSGLAENESLLLGIEVQGGGGLSVVGFSLFVYVLQGGGRR